MVFAQRLVARLDTEHLESWVDWAGIPYSAEWWDEICKGIYTAKNFAFIISPDSLASRVCNLELAYARENNKRIIPIMRREPDIKVLAGEWFGEDWEPTARSNYHTLQKLNYIFIRKQSEPRFQCEYDEDTKEVTNPECDGPESDADDFETSVRQLLETVSKDPKYIEEHTRLQVLAHDWQRQRGGLLRGNELIAAEAWLAGSGDKNPAPTDMHGAYITASRKASRRQQRLLIAGTTLAFAIMLVLTVLSLVFSQQSRSLLDQSKRQGTAIARQAGTATVAQGQALNSAATAVAAQLSADRRAEEAQSMALAASAQQLSMIG